MLIDLPTVKSRLPVGNWVTWPTTRGVLKLLILAAEEIGFPCFLHVGVGLGG